MYNRLEKRMPGGPGWKTAEIILQDAPKEPQKFYYCDPVACAEYLFRNPTFNECMLYEPTRIFQADNQTRIFHEMTTGEIWNELQVSDNDSVSVVFSNDP